MIWRDMATSRFDNGLIAEDWVITDLAERLLLPGNESEMALNGPNRFSQSALL